MSNSILVQKSVFRVLGALVLAAGGPVAVACPPEESGKVIDGQLLELGQAHHVQGMQVFVSGQPHQIEHFQVRRGQPISISAGGQHVTGFMLPHLVAGVLDEPSQSVTVMSHSDGNDSYVVTIKDGKVSAQANGKDLPEDRIRRKGDTIELLDKDGDVVATFQSPAAPQAPKATRDRTRVRTGTFTPLARTAPGGTNVVVGQQVEPPPVMLGITMSEDPDEDTEGVTLTSILPGLPAEKAGLKVADRVIEMDGTKIKNQQDLRGVIRSKKAGDDLKIKVVREGQDKEITVNLEAFSAERMKDAGAPQWWERMQQNQGSHDSKWDDAKQQIERALEQVRNNPNLNTEKMKEKAVAALEKALKSVEESKAKMQTEIRAWAADPNRGGMIFGDRPQQLFVAPSPTAPSVPQNDATILRRMERIADSLERLDKRLDEIEKRLNEREQGSKPQR